MRARRLVSGLAALVIGAGGAWIAPGAYAAGAVTKVEFLLDASSAMGGNDVAGRPKAETVRESVTTAAHALGSGVQVGVRSYGGKVGVGDPKTPAAGACDDTDKLADLAGGNHRNVDDALGKYAAKGYAPLAGALKAADHDLGSDGARRIVLVSSGASHCTPEPCAAAMELRKGGSDVVIDVIGVGVTPEQDEDRRAQLTCIAAVTGGTYMDVLDTPGANNVMRRLGARIERGRDFVGSRTNGADSAAGTGAALTPGAYTDLVQSKRTRYYKVSVPAGSSVMVSALVRPPLAASYGGGELKIELTNGTEKCGNADAPNIAGVSAGGNLIVGTAYYDPAATSRSGSGSPGCTGLKELTAAVTFTGDDDKLPPMPVSLVVSTAPWRNDGIGDVSELSGGKGYVGQPVPPDPYDEKPQMPVPAAAPATANVAGGTSFVTAAELKPGVTADTPGVGELSFYKVKLDWGQQAVLRVDTDEPKEFSTAIMAYGPRRTPLYSAWDWPGLKDSEDVGGDNRDKYVAAYIGKPMQNAVFADAPAVYAAAEPGWYYFSVATKPSPDGARLAAPVKLRLNLAVDGRAGEGAPKDYQQPSIPGLSDDTATGPTSMSVLDRATAAPVAVLGMAGIACLVGGAVWLARRGR